MTDNERLFLTIQSHLDKIERLFDYPVSITLLVRTPTLTQSTLPEEVDRNYWDNWLVNVLRENGLA